MNSCEAEIEIDGMWASCGKTPAHVHHMLTRARGGLLLDEVGETYHQIRLCVGCHKIAHDQTGHDLIIKGQVLTYDGRPIYYGPDEYLSNKYGE